MAAVTVKVILVGGRPVRGGTGEVLQAGFIGDRCPRGNLFWLTVNNLAKDYGLVCNKGDTLLYVYSHTLHINAFLIWIYGRLWTILTDFKTDALAKESSRDDEASKENT